MAFKKGDIVKLKSGGPKMTISGFDHNLAICVWFDDNNEHKFTRIDQEALIIADEDDDVTLA